MEYIYQLINTLKHWLGLTNERNYEIFYQLLHDKKYEEAIELAQRVKYLDIDLVYKCKWRNSGITVQSIESNLVKIQDKLWVINECSKTVPLSYEACRKLIEFGLKEANLKLLYQLGYEEQPSLAEDIGEDKIEGLVDFDHLNERQKELCRCRQNLLRHQHFLTVYANILGDDYRTVQQQFDHVYYDEFRRKCPLEACLDFAHEGDAIAIEKLLNFHTEDLSPHLIAILSNIPETISPFCYRNLLPCLREGETIYEWRAASDKTKREEFDWSNQVVDTFLVSLKDIGKDFEKDFYQENEYLKKYLQPLTGDILSQWYIERALEIESRTLLVTNAIQLLILGKELNIKNLAKTHDALVEFRWVVYDCYTDENIYLSFSEFNNASKHLAAVANQTLALEDFNACHEACRIIMERNYRDCWKICCQLGMHKEYKNFEAKYKLLAYALAYCDDVLESTKILNYVIELRKRDEVIQLAYLKLNM